MPKSQGLKIDWIKSNRFNCPETNFYQPKEDKNLISELLKPSLFEKNCQKVCSKKIELLPPTTVDAHSGLGYYMINVDGFRYLNAYIISDPLSSSTMRGFTLEISFSINDFVYGVGVVGETSHFFNFDNYYKQGDNQKKLVHIGTSDQTSTGGVPQLGGKTLTHILRIPILGPYVRASVFNEDGADREVTVIGYLTT